MSDSDSEDTFVVLGTPLKPYEEDEPVKKQFDIQNQKVKDARGRQRFHGAFTGGFSAGYFNTVGSKEGWTPSTFVSSRGSRAGGMSQRPEDFMDEEDLGEYGIAPRVVKATEDFRSGQAAKRPLISDRLIPGEAPLATLIKPASCGITMGVRLLRKLGWRDGQGIGPRIRKKKRSRRSEGKKIYGCLLPGVESNQASSSEEDISDLTAANLTFAPKDICPIDFKPKDNLFGVGYSGMRIGHETGHFQLFDETSEVRLGEGKRGIRGQAFGVGALEDDDDDDVYASDKLSNYDRVLGGSDKTGTFGWTAPINEAGGSNKDYADSVLEGFKLMSIPLQPRKVYPPPQLPRDFKPYHIFTEEENAVTRMAQEIPKKFSMTWKKMDVSRRREALGEKPDIKSVFDLVNEKDKQHIKSCQTVDSSPVSSSSQTNDKIQQAKAQLLAGITSRFHSAGTEVISPLEQTSSSTATTAEAAAATTITTTTAQPVISTPKETTPLYKGSVGFKPFASDPEKQARYEKYLAATASGNKSEYEHSTDHMTEWERSREKDEFARASQLYRPMSSLMAFRFTQAKFKDEDKVIVNKEQEGDASDQAEAAKMKMYGRLTHDILEWHPDKLLCKRFNVPNPYPDSSIVGLPKVKRDKFSIFNFLSIPGEDTSGTDQSMSLVQSNDDIVEQQENRGGRKKKLGQQGKPLAILASIDLTQPSHKPEVKQGSADQDKGSKTEEEVEAKTDEMDAAASVLASRPPPDIFKAVFGDSDAEESSSDEDDDDDDGEAVEKKINGASHAGNESQNMTQNQTQPSFNGSSNCSPQQPLVHKQTREMEAYDTFGVKIDLPKSGLRHEAEHAEQTGLQTVDNDKIMDIKSSDIDLSDAYGPPLPPSLGVEAKSYSSPTRRPEQHRKKKKHKEKEKHKHKKKSKHRKHKEKKKKKKKEVIVIGTPSGSEADTEDSYSSDQDIERTSKVRTLN